MRCSNGITHAIALLSEIHLAFCFILLTLLGNAKISKVIELTSILSHGN